MKSQQLGERKSNRRKVMINNKGDCNHESSIIGVFVMMIANNEHNNLQRCVLYLPIMY